MLALAFDRLAASAALLIPAAGPIARYVPLRLVKFLTVGGSGLIVNLAILGILIVGGGLPFWAAQAIAVVVAMTSNFLLNNAFTYRDRRLEGSALLRGLLSFYLACGLGGTLNVEVGSAYLHGGGAWWMAGIIGAVAGALWNFTACSVLTWRR